MGADRAAVVWASSAGTTLERERLLTQDFSAEERATLIALLARMLANVEAVNTWDPMAESASPAKRRCSAA